MTGAVIMPGTLSRGGGKPAFRMSLNPNIGLTLDQQGLLDKAIEYGYNAIACIPGDLMKMDDDKLQAFIDKMESNNITWGSTNLPIDFRNDIGKYKEGLATMPEVCAIMQKAGATRMNTWIMPTHADYTYLQNFELHRTRLKEAANIAGHHGIRLGLEYVGPKTLMARSKYAFIRTMAEAKELIAAIDESNVGFVLDTFHWYCAGESKVDLLTLDKEDIVVIDLNDARTGFERDEQVDGKRELPLATGVIPIADFMQAMAEIGYDGPMRAEPFNQPLRDMENDAAIKATYEAMSKAFALGS